MQTRSFIGLDVHKDTISVSIAEDGRDGVVRFIGVIANTPDEVARWRNDFLAVESSISVMRRVAADTAFIVSSQRLDSLGAGPDT